MLPRLARFQSHALLISNSPPFATFCRETPDGYGLFTAVSPTKATWTFKTVQPDNGAAGYTDSLTILKGV